MTNEKTTRAGSTGPGDLSFLAPIARQYGFIVVFALSSIATALALTYVYSEKYESSTAISYRVQDVTRFGFRAQQSEAMGSPAPAAPFKVVGQTLQEVLKSDAILRDVVVALKLDEKRVSRYDGPWYQVFYEKAKNWAKEYGAYAVKLLKYGRIVEDDPVATAIAELRNNIKVVNRDSYVFNLQVRDNYPDRAAKIADYLGKVLAEWLLEFDRQPGRSRAEHLRELLDAKQLALAERRKEIVTLLTRNRLASVPRETESLTDQLYALKLEESRLASEIERAAARHASTQSKLAIKQRALGQAVAVGGSGAGIPSPESGNAVEFIQPEDFKKLASQDLFDSIESSSLRAKHASLQKSIEEINLRLRGLPAVQGRLDALKLSLDTMERDYSLLNDSYQEAAVRATSPISEVQVLHPATVPTSPVGPIKIYYVMLAGGLGLLFALGLVYLLDFLNVRILFASRGPSWRAPMSVAIEPKLDETQRPEPSRMANNG